MNTATHQVNDLIKDNQLQELITVLKNNPDAANVPDSRGFTPLVMAAYVNNLEAVQMLLEYGAEVNYQDRVGNTALMGTCFKGYLEIAELLLQHGADVNLISENGASALIYAVNFNQPALVKLLLESGADSSIKDSEGHSLEEQALAKGNQEMALLLKGSV